MASENVSPKPPSSEMNTNASGDDVFLQASQTDWSSFDEMKSDGYGSLSKMEFTDKLCDQMSNDVYCTSGIRESLYKLALTQNHDIPQMPLHSQITFQANSNVELCKQISVEAYVIFRFLLHGEEIDWKNGYMVVLQHPVTTEYEASRDHINETL